ncbi:MAG: hypothetical protein AAGF12_00520 [Myxococcota bacterium]
MGYDISFQLVDADKIASELIPALVAGDPPPKSAFDDHENATKRWTTARERVLESPTTEAATEVCALVIQWSAASLPSVWTRNFGVTYEPLRMSEHLHYPPSQGYGGPERLFGALIKARPELRGAFPSAITSNGSPGGFCERPNGPATHEWWKGTQYDRTAGRYLSIVRAAERHGLAVYESAELHESFGSDDNRLLAWPGLTRSGVEDWALSLDEWEEALVHLPSFGAADRVDAIECAVRINPDTHRGLMLAVCEALGVAPETLAQRRSDLGLVPAPEWKVGDYGFAGGLFRVIEKKEMMLAGETRRFLVTRMFAENRNTMVPDPPANPMLVLSESQIERVDLASAGKEILDVVAQSTALGDPDMLTWNRRYQAQRALLRSHRYLDIATLYASLVQTRAKKGELSYGETSMFNAAESILASMLSHAESIELSEAKSRLEAAATSRG